MLLHQHFILTSKFWLLYYFDGYHQILKSWTMLRFDFRYSRYDFFLLFKDCVYGLLSCVNSIYSFSCLHPHIQIFVNRKMSDDSKIPLQHRGQVLKSDHSFTRNTNFSLKNWLLANNSSFIFDICKVCFHFLNKREYCFSTHPQTRRHTRFFFNAFKNRKRLGKTSKHFQILTIASKVWKIWSSV